eukprot:12428397-Alexandrium_andersonii.AAC.1
MLAVSRSGRNPTMRHLRRAHRVSAQRSHERFILFPQNVEIFYEDSCDMCADTNIKILTMSQNGHTLVT